MDSELPPPGDTRRATAMFVLALVMVIVAAIFVALRLIGRYYRSMLQIDDWTILASLVWIHIPIIHSHAMLVIADEI